MILGCPTGVPSRSGGSRAARGQDRPGRSLECLRKPPGCPRSDDRDGPRRGVCGHRRSSFLGHPDAFMWHSCKRPGHPGSGLGHAWKRSGHPWPDVWWRGCQSLDSPTDLCYTQRGRSAGFDPLAAGLMVMEAPKRGHHNYRDPGGGVPFPPWHRTSTPFAARNSNDSGSPPGWAPSHVSVSGVSHTPAASGNRRSHSWSRGVRSTHPIR